MHYIRLLRPATLNTIDRKYDQLSLLFTITTDLGECFFAPTSPVSIKVCLDNDEHYMFPASIDNRPITWREGMRVLDAKLRVSKTWVKGSVTVYIFPTNIKSSNALPQRGDVDSYPWRLGNRTFWESPMQDALRPDLIIPVSIKMINRVCTPISLRTLEVTIGPQPGDMVNLTFEEDIGESIARHIWDGGLVTAAYLGELCRSRGSIQDILPIGRETINILELGSGVGILGITLGSIIWKAARVQGKELRHATVLLSDLPEAEERAGFNMSHARTAYESCRPEQTVTTLQYENLSWDDGMEGRFGPLAQSHYWDYIVLSDCTYNVDSLPALVGTLSALHLSNQKKAAGEHDDVKKITSVVLATKPRHSSEQALFEMLAAENWSHRLLKPIPLPKIDAEDEAVEICLLQKGCGII